MQTIYKLPIVLIVEQTRHGSMPMVRERERETELARVCVNDWNVAITKQFIQT